MPIDPILPAQHLHPDRNTQLRKAAEELEAGFLAQMLEDAGLGKPSASFGGGAGEDQFASFLVQEHAREMVRAGGIGLTEMIFEALKEKENE